MNLSVILCTFNRSVALRKALESIVGQTIHNSVEWEVLVVDNNSKDETREVIEDFCYRYPGRFRYLFEPEQGKSQALNSGIREARGDIIAFTDDDVIAESTWLQNLTSSLSNADWVGAGGRTLPQKAFSAPDWLACDDSHALGPLAMFDKGCEPRELDEPPYGNNMAYRKEVFEKYGDFRNELGPRPGNQIRGEDTEFGQRLLTAGERLVYEPSAVVYHDVPEKRVTKAYFLDWWFDKGRAGIEESGIPSDAKWLVAGIPILYFSRLVVWTCRWMCGTTSSRRFSCQRRVWWLAGTVVQCFRKSHAKRVLGS